jgi:protein SCO1
MRLRIVACIAALALSGCRGRGSVTRHTEPVAAPRPVIDEPAAPVAAQPSIYDLPIQLHAASGATVGLDIARGHRVLISMFYASCPVACPVLIDELEQTVAELPPDVRVVLVSFDPARDTADRLRELAAERGLNERWIVASASDSDARTLAAVLGIKYRKLDSGEFFHGATIVALDEGGHPIARTDGFGKRGVLVSALAR